MTAPPLVSVIMATYNADRFISFSIQSVINQSFKNFELIVIGDGCTDHTQEVVSSFADDRISWYNLPQNIGSQGIPNNEGISRARGKYIAYLSHDDLWFPWHLEELLTFLQKNNADWVHSCHFAVLPNNFLHFSSLPPLGFNYSNFFMGPSNWLHKKILVEQVGFWRHHHEADSYLDQDLQSRIAYSGAVMCGLEVPSVIKFYAREWKMLSKVTVFFPQKDYLEKILSDAHHLQNTLLKQIAIQYGQEIHNRNWGGFSVVEALKILLWRPFRRWVILPAKQHIPIVKKIAIWKMQRLRRQRDKEVGTR